MDTGFAVGLKGYAAMTSSLKEFFEDHKKVALAFSGGTDSSYLLYAATECGADVRAYYVKSQFQPEFELADAKAVAAQCGAEMKVIELDILSAEEVISNPPDRCYHCKQRIMGAILEAARLDGYETVMDGTNASDDADDRPGFRALKEYGIVSPLRECGITKDEVRGLAKAAGLKIWDKPAYACLATRVPSGTRITERDLQRTELAEKLLFDMGYRDIRVRLRDGAALVQMSKEELDRALLEEKRIQDVLGNMYDKVTIDRNPR